MNPAFFQQVETALALGRLDACRQDGTTPVIALEQETEGLFREITKGATP